jgi:hypothetical protein
VAADTLAVADTAAVAAVVDTAAVAVAAMNAHPWRRLRMAAQAHAMRPSNSRPV